MDEYMYTYSNIINNLSSKKLILDTVDSVICHASKKKLRKYNLDTTPKQRYRKFRDLIKAYQQPPHERKKIIEGSKSKARWIVSPSIDEVIVQHILCKPLKDYTMRRVLPNVFGSLPGRGQHDAAQRVKRWVMKGKKGSRYCLQLDIKRFFDNVDTKVLKKKLRKIFKDKAYLKSLFAIIDFQDEGLPLGFYTSHWLAHFYLLDMDEYIVHELKPKHYIRYVDDILILSNRKKDLHKIRTKLSKYIEKKLGLKFKSNYQVFRVSYYNKAEGREKGKAIDFLGYKIHYNRTSVRKSILKKFRGKAYKVGRDGLNAYVARQLTSYLGWMKHTDMFDYYQNYIQKSASMKMVRNYISKYDKKQNKKRREAAKQNRLNNR